MSDVKARLALLNTVLDEAAPPVDVAEIQLRAQTAPVVPDVASRRVRPAWIAAAAAAAATLILVGGLTLMLRTGDRSEMPPVTTPPATTVTTTPIAVDPVASEAGWSRWPLDPLVFGNAAVLDVVSYDGTLVAVGATYDCVECGASVWLSGNGVEWTRAFTDPDAWFMRAAAVGEHGIAAVGDGTTDLGEPIAAVWTSADGTDWTRGELPGGSQAWDVASGGPGYVAVGSVDRVEGDTIYEDAAVWTSTDGSVWTRVEDNADLFTNAWITTIVTTPDGFAAIGSTPVSFEVDEDGDRWYKHSLGVWTSLDGLAWKQQDVSGTDVDPWVWDAVAEGDAVLIASDAGLWLSTDLSEWQQVSPWFARSVTFTGSSFFAALQNELLQSDDATNWVPVTDDPSILFTTGQNIEMTAIRPGGPGLIAFGIDYSAPGQGALHLWTWSPNQ